MFSVFKSGSWITHDRLVGYSSILIGVYIIAIGWILLTAPGQVDSDHRPIGTDFSNVWVAGKMVLQGSPELPYDPARHFAEQRRHFNDPQVDVYGWHYPPPFLAIAGILALMPYLLALFVWQATTLSLYLLVVSRIVRERMGLLLAVAYPAVFVNLTHGQNGFLTAALLGGGLVALRTRPILAGVLFGLLAFKPHFGFILPFALAAGGYWRTFISASITVIALIAGTILLYGVDIWPAFFESTKFTSGVALETGNTGWYKLQSAFAALRMIGGSVALAYGVQIVIALCGLVAVVWLWRSSADFAVKAAGLITASLLATPYLLDYDLMVLAPAIAFLASHGLKNGFLPYEKAALAFIWVAPLLSRPIGIYIPISIAFFAMACFLAVIFARAVHETRKPR